MDITDCRAGAQLNICDDTAVDRLCAALSCLPADVYQAVAFVGDRVCCIQAHLRRAGRSEDARPLRGGVQVLPRAHHGREHCGHAARRVLSPEP